MSKRTTNSGDEPVLSDDSPVPNESKRSDGQHVDHWVLSKEERSKKYNRPLRKSYMHVGLSPQHPLRDLTEEEKESYRKYEYIKFEKYPESELPMTGKFWSQKDLDRKGCGSVTSVPFKIAETYAVNPRYYGTTFCCCCGEYFPVGEFVWEGSDERVGS